jgi:magnesium chelatase family protein
VPYFSYATICHREVALLRMLRRSRVGSLPNTPIAVASIITPCLHGAQVVPVRIEEDIQPGLPLFTIIGLPDKRIDEVKERVRSALKISGQVFPLGKITIKLSPSNMSKAGTAFDLGIALGILVASSRIRALPDSVWVLGELSFDSLVRPINLLPAYLVETLKRAR